MTEGSSARSPWRLTPSAFDTLLTRLGADREAAGAEFEQLRRRLVLFFSYEGLADAEFWADETLDRVAKRIEGGSEVENIAAFSKGVARLVRLEARQLKSKDSRSAQEFGLHRIRTEQAGSAQERELLYKRLEDCLTALGGEDRSLVLEYYEGEKSRRIRNREKIASRLGITIESLRNRAMGLRRRLEACLKASQRGSQSDVFEKRPQSIGKGKAEG